MALIYLDQNTNYTGEAVYSGCLKMPFESYFLRECISNRMDLEGGVNCTNLLQPP